MRHTNYAPEIATASRFLENHKDDIVLMNFIEIMQSPFYTHSERWGRIYDFILKHYPSEVDTIVTGLTYYCEG